MKLAQLDISTMNDLEMRGILLNLIAKAKRKQLIRLFETFKNDKDEYIEVDTDIENLPYALSLEQEAELAEAIEETYHEENLISHEEALNELSRWLPK